ncbi:MAG: TGS domain-containing protein, partial [Planctomycetota bacterium]
RFKEARTREEKIEALEGMLAVIPKHKGTEHLQGDIRKRLSSLRKQGGKKSGAARRVASPYAIPRAGAGQVVVIGPPNAGKSALVGAVTNAHVTVAPHPFATTVPVPAMMEFDTIRVQLVDTPPLMPDHTDHELVQLLGRADMALLVLSAADPELLDQIEWLESDLFEQGIQLVDDPETVDEVRTVGGAVRTLVVLTGFNLDDAEVGAELLHEVLGDRLPVVRATPTTGEGMDTFRREVWRRLHAVRVFTKQPGQKADLGEPFFLREGETVADLASKIHRDFIETLKFARLWGEGVHDGQPVTRQHVLHDGDVIELHE